MKYKLPAAEFKEYYNRLKNPNTKFSKAHDKVL